LIWRSRARASVSGAVLLGLSSFAGGAGAWPVPSAAVPGCEAGQPCEAAAPAPQASTPSPVEPAAPASAATEVHPDSRPAAAVEATADDQHTARAPGRPAADAEEPRIR